MKCSTQHNCTMLKVNSRRLSCGHNTNPWPFTLTHVCVWQSRARTHARLAGVHGNTIRAGRHTRIVDSVVVQEVAMGPKHITPHAHSRHWCFQPPGWWTRHQHLRVAPRLQLMMRLALELRAPTRHIVPSPSSLEGIFYGVF
jgi:hypothetical protein